MAYQPFVGYLELKPSLRKNIVFKPKAGEKRVLYFCQAYLSKRGKKRCQNSARLPQTRRLPLTLCDMKSLDQHLKSRWWNPFSTMIIVSVRVPCNPEQTISCVLKTGTDIYIYIYIEREERERERRIKREGERYEARK